MPRAVVFDLGGVLVDWDPANLYRKLLPGEAEVRAFLADVCVQSWNEQQDAGRSAKVATAELSARFPDQAHLIEAYYSRFDEMIAGLIEENLDLADRLRAEGVELLALTNWSADTFHVLDRYDLLDRFEGRVLVSGRVGVKKPDPAIYRLFCETFERSPDELLFIDDSLANVSAAEAERWKAVHFVRGESIAEKVLAWALAGR